jgi:hypothetical protein
MLRNLSLFALLFIVLCLSGCPAPSNTNNARNANNANNANAPAAPTAAPAGAPTGLNLNGNTAERPPGELPGEGSGNREGGRGVTGPGLPANENAVTTGDANTAPPFRVEPGRTNRNSRTNSNT